MLLHNSISKTYFHLLYMEFFLIIRLKNNCSLRYPFFVTALGCMELKFFTHSSSYTQLSVHVRYVYSPTSVSQYMSYMSSLAFLLFSDLFNLLLDNVSTYFFSLSCSRVLTALLASLSTISGDSMSICSMCVRFI